MAKLTLLDIVSDIMSDMSSDAVTSVGDTTESERVLAIVKSTYFKMMEEKNWPHLGNTIQLGALSDVNTPSHMTIPEAIRRVEWIKYDSRTDAGDPVAQRDIDYLTPEEFLSRVNSRDSTAANVQVVTDPSGIALNIRNDVHPTAWTSFDDTYIVFDSFYSSLDTTLQASKTQCFGFKEPVWGGSFTVHAISTSYALNDIMSATPGATVYFYRCSSAGTTNAVDQEANYPEVVGASYVDGTATFVMVGTSSVDAFIPDLPAHMFPLFLSQAKSACFNKIKQVVDSLEERDARRQRVVMQQVDHKNRQDGDKLQYGYGRK